MFEGGEPGSVSTRLRVFLLGILFNPYSVDPESKVQVDY